MQFVQWTHAVGRKISDDMFVDKKNNSVKQNRCITEGVKMWMTWLSTKNVRLIVYGPKKHGRNILKESCYVLV
jgi:hypothetical protein